jgi:uncharacterized membrane protein YuzA (DUF378 family)
MNKALLEKIAYILVVFGGINWGLYGISTGLNIVHIVLGTSLLANLVYIIIGVSAGYLVYLRFFDKKAA